MNILSKTDCGTDCEPKQNELTHIDLFAGIGGFSLAFEAEGFRTVAFAETDEFASGILSRTWPGVPNFGDVRQFPTIPCDVLTGGFPCQPFSTSGVRGGAQDDRFLWPAMLDVIERCQPAFVCAENVPGIISMELDRCLADLESRGYPAQPIIVPACAVGSKHWRERVIILAYSVRRWESLGRDMGGTRRKRQLDEKPSEWEITSESPFLGVDARLPKRLHRPRCRALGNSVMPQVIRPIARAIYQHLTAFHGPQT